MRVCVPLKEELSIVTTFYYCSISDDEHSHESRGQYLKPVLRIRITLMRSPDSDASFQFDTDPDPTFHFDADPDPTFHFDADPDSEPTSASGISP
jgi:hypothetical protein